MYIYIYIYVYSSCRKSPLRHRHRDAEGIPPQAATRQGLQQHQGAGPRTWRMIQVTVLEI